MTHSVITEIGKDSLFTVDEGTNRIEYNGTLLNANQGQLTMWLGAGLKGSYPSPAYVTGMRDVIVSGLNATDGTDRPVGNNHVMLNVSALTGTGVVVVTGDSVDESDGVVTSADTENITVDATGLYQTDKKWLRTTDITIPGGISGITYAIERLGYWDFSNNDYTVLGYRCEVTPTNAGTITFKIQIYKVQDDGDKKTTCVLMEDIDLDGGGGNYINDTLRSGADDRAYNASTPFKVAIPHVIKQTDFNDYFSSDENIIEGSTKHEGIYIVLTWTNADYYSLALNYKAD